MLLREQQQENMLLREILNSRNIPFEVELQQRKNAMAIGGPQSAQGISPSYPVTQSSPFNNAMQAAPLQPRMTDLHQPGYANGPSSVISGHSPGHNSNPSPQTHHSNSTPEIPEVGVVKSEGVAVMPGIFERDPQLGIDFILACVILPCRSCFG